MGLAVLLVRLPSPIYLSLVLLRLPNSDLDEIIGNQERTI